MRRVILAAFLLLAGCNHYEPLSLHGAASLRVEVEVYKGPLSVPVEGQVGELVGVVSDSVRVISDWRERALAQRCDNNMPTADCQLLLSAIESSADVLEAGCRIVEAPTLEMTIGRGVTIPAGACGYAERRSWMEGAMAAVSKPDLLTTRANQIADLKAEAADCKSRHPRDLQQQFRCQGQIIGVGADNLSAILRGAARRTSDRYLARLPQGAILALLVEYGSLTAEYGEQIHSRITVLQKQLADATIRDSRTLPVSDYLRDAGRTDYIQLFDWLGAGDSGRLTPAERVRMAQRLTADSYWQKVNEVYTSGQGDVATAFIKDDLGNWDLKSFSNDPSDLLASYRNVTDAALKTAANLARRAATGNASAAVDRISTAARAASLANQLATGEVAGDPAQPAGVDLQRLHDGVARRIADQKVRFVALEARLTSERDAAKKAVEDAEAVRIQREAAVATSQATLTGANAAYDSASQALVEALRALDAQEGDTTEAEDTVKRARDTLKERQDAVGAAQSTLLSAQRELADAAGKKNAEEAKLAAAQQRLDGLLREAAEAVRGTLDDHLSVISALQEGLAPSAPVGPVSLSEP